jgi:large subunit ribosomal protein L32
MAVPKRRTSKSKQGTRRAHHFLTPKGVQYCSNCSEPNLPHRICANCGYYQNREVVKTDEAEGK